MFLICQISTGDEPPSKIAYNGAELKILNKNDYKQITPTSVVRFRTSEDEDSNGLKGRHGAMNFWVKNVILYSEIAISHFIAFDNRANKPWFDQEIIGSSVLDFSLGSTRKDLTVQKVTGIFC